MQPLHDDEWRRFHEGLLIGCLVSLILWAIILAIAWALYVNVYASAV